MCSIMFWSYCAMLSSCLGTVFVSWSGTIAAWWGWSWQVKTQLMTASYVDEWIHFTEKGNWFGHQTVCHRHPGIWCSTVNENCGHVIEPNEFTKVTKASRWLQRTSHTYTTWAALICTLCLSKHRIVELVNVFIYYVHIVCKMDCVKLVCVFIYHAESFVILPDCLKSMFRCMVTYTLVKPRPLWPSAV